MAKYQIGQKVGKECYCRSGVWHPMCCNTQSSFAPTTTTTGITSGSLLAQNTDTFLFTAPFVARKFVFSGQSNNSQMKSFQVGDIAKARPTVDFGKNSHLVTIDGFDISSARIEYLSPKELQDSIEKSNNLEKMMNPRLSASSEATAATQNAGDTPITKNSTEPQPQRDVTEGGWMTMLFPGYGGANARVFVRLLIFIIVVALLIYAYRNRGNIKNYINNTKAA
jgi:hypothetical protein